MAGTFLKWLAGIALVGTLLPATSSAQWRSGFGNRTPGIDHREQQQMVRIRRGTREGQITRWEARRLLAEQRQIRLQERWAARDASVNRWERQRLNRELNRASRHIYWARHNRFSRTR